MEPDGPTLHLARVLVRLRVLVIHVQAGAISEAVLGESNVESITTFGEDPTLRMRWGLRKSVASNRST
jgi:hypothetical protein